MHTTGVILRVDNNNFWYAVRARARVYFLLS